MAEWTTRTVLSGASIARNGTNSHTCTFTAATAGNFLVAIVAGPITFTTPSGWTLLTSAVNYSTVYVFTKTASASESSFSTTHNDSNLPILGIVYEFPPGTVAYGGTSAIAQAYNTTTTGPQITGLGGTYTRFAARTVGSDRGDTTFSAAWTVPSIEDYDVLEVDNGASDGLALTIAYDDNNTASSFNPSANLTVTNTNYPHGEGVSFVLQHNNWVNRTALSGSSINQNGTTSHTCTFTPAATGNFLVAVIASCSTSSTPSGWTLLNSIATVSGLYVFTKTATNGESSFTTTHADSNVAIKGIVYEFPAGTTAVGSNSTGGQSYIATGPAVSGLTGTYDRFTARSWLLTTGISTSNVDWTLPSFDDYDQYVPRQNSVDGVGLSVATNSDVTGSSFTPSSHFFANDTAALTGEAIAFALQYTAPPLIASYATVFNTDSQPKTLSVTTQAGDLVVVCATSGNGIHAFGTPSGNSISFTQQQYVHIDSNWSDAAIWTGTDSAGGTNWTLSLSKAAQNGSFGMACLVFRGISGIGASSKTNVSGAAPSLDLTTTQANSAIVVVNADWNAVDGASRIWRTVNSITPSSSNMLERTYAYTASDHTVYVAYYNNVGSVGTKTVGLSAPSSQKYSIAALEIMMPSSSSATAVTAWLRF